MFGKVVSLNLWNVQTGALHYHVLFNLFFQTVNFFKTFLELELVVIWLVSWLGFFLHFDIYFVPLTIFFISSSRSGSSTRSVQISQTSLKIDQTGEATIRQLLSTLATASICKL